MVEIMKIILTMMMMMMMAMMVVLIMKGWCNRPSTVNAVLLGGVD